MPKAFIISDLGYGDSGKGTIVDYLAHKNKPGAVIRYNGGAQAAHNVVRPDKVEHTFQQFGSGSFEGIPTYLSEYMVVEPARLLDEAMTLSTKGIQNPLSLMYIDPRALLITPFHREMCRLRERMRGSQRHGSTGLGVGESRALFLSNPELAIKVRDINSPNFNQKLRDLAEYYASQAAIEYEVHAEVNDYVIEIFSDTCKMLEKHDLIMHTPDDYLESLFTEEKDIIFEGAQGILLDEWYGFYPYTTWTDTTTRNARSILNKYRWPGELESIGVMRTYMTRHGPGPFPTESKILDLPEFHNKNSDFAGEFRVGWPDLPMFKYAIAVSGGIDSLAITHWDYLSRMNNFKIALGYFVGTSSMMNIPVPKEFPVNLIKQEELTKILLKATPIWRTEDAGYIGIFMEENLGLPISLTSRGPTWQDKLVRVDARHTSMV